MKNENRLARLTGLGYLIIFITGFFANFYTLESLITNDSAAQTARTIAANRSKFDLGLAAFSIMVLIDILLAFPLYQLLKGAGKKQSKISSGLRIINGLLFGAALLNLFSIGALANTGVDLLEAKIPALLQAFERTWDVGLLFFGLHLLLLGRLIVRAKNFPAWIGALLIIAGFAYLTDSGLRLFLPGNETLQAVLEMAVIFAGVAGEFSLTIWLLVKGANKKQV